MKSQLISIKKGDCIRIACENVTQNKDWLFCYAYVMGQGELIGQRILHAWNEFGDVVFDFSNGKRIVMRKEIYYETAKITEKEVIRQNYDELIKCMFKTKSYGGWIK